MAGIGDAPFIKNLAVPSVCLLISFLGYGSQLAFSLFEISPGPLPRSESIVFNTLLLLLWLTYYRAITVDPGRYVFTDRVLDAEGRWCSKCEAPKPPRAHHCRHCRRCVPRMDHHCPWTANCVSLTTFPHFMRFLFYTNVALCYLGSLLWQRWLAVWASRLLPAYLGPTLGGLISLSLLSLIYFPTAVALGIMLFTAGKSWVFNQTLIEAWELERHEADVDKAGRDWWDIYGPDGEKVRFEKLEFPYDVGFFTNMAQAMGTKNFLLWLWPLAGNPKIQKDGRGIGWEWEENGFNRVEGLWPPPDADKIRRGNKPWPAAKRDYKEELRLAELSPEEIKAEFARRQAEDQRRKQMLLAELEEVDDYDVYNDDDDDDDGLDARSGWANSEGERLHDFGVDEGSDASGDEFVDDDVPLAELIRRRNVFRQDKDD